MDEGAIAAGTESAKVELIGAAEPGVEAIQRVTKRSIVLDLLRREEGALLSEIVDATGWLPHTARAALTGLKKKGHGIVSTKVDKFTRYTLA